MCSLSPLSFSDILPDMESALLCRWNYTKKRDEIPIQKSSLKIQITYCVYQNVVLWDRVNHNFTGRLLILKAVTQDQF